MFGRFFSQILKNLAFLGEIALRYPDICLYLKCLLLNYISICSRFQIMPINWTFDKYFYYFSYIICNQLKNVKKIRNLSKKKDTATVLHQMTPYWITMSPSLSSLMWFNLKAISLKLFAYLFFLTNYWNVVNWLKYIIFHIFFIFWGNLTYNSLKFSSWWALSCWTTKFVLRNQLACVRTLVQ